MKKCTGNGDTYMSELASDRQVAARSDGSLTWPSATTPSRALLTDTVSLQPTSVPASTWRNNVLEQLRQLGSLAPNWDGEGGLVPKVDILNSAAGLIDEILRHAPTIAEPYIRPTPNGGILLAWQRVTRGEDMEVELETPGVATFVYSTNNGTEFIQGIICHDGRPLQEDDFVFLRLLLRFGSQ